MDSEWSWNDLTAVVPIVASSFAFTYVIGYFYAFDIAWFTFFTLSEHVTFALRALPMAIGASVVFMIGMRFSEFEHEWEWLKGFRPFLAIVWVIVLIVAALYAGLVKHYLGLAISFVAVAGGAYIHHRKPTPYMSFASVLYWAGTLMVGSFIVGFLSGSVWYVRKWFPAGHSTIVLVDPQPKKVEAGQPESGPSGRSTSRPASLFGRVVFAGQSGVLFYEVELETGVRLVLWKDIKMIIECNKRSVASSDQRTGSPPRKHGNDSYECTDP